METLYVVKIGGNIIDNQQALESFLASFSLLKGNKILVHGGGKLATQMAKQLGVEQQMIDGRRVTDAATLRIVTMVYAGYINKNIVAGLQANGTNAIGLSGADGDFIRAHKRVHSSVDYGFVGDVDQVNAALLQTLLEKEITVVAAPVTHNGQGMLLNTNADTIAQEIAKAMSAAYRVQLVYSFEKKGVLLDVNDENSVIARMDTSAYAELKQSERIFAGMIPKLDNAFTALENGVERVIIGMAEELHELVAGTKGTTISK